MYPATNSSKSQIHNPASAHLQSIFLTLDSSAVLTQVNLTLNMMQNFTKSFYTECYFRENLHFANYINDENNHKHITGSKKIKNKKLK